ncbi:MAG: CHASE domain-containing protein [Candidatus Rifleibacteriota bacterium]
MAEQIPEAESPDLSTEELLKRRAMPTMGRKVFPYVTLVILVLLSLLAWQHFEGMVEQRQRRLFGYEVETKIKAIQERLIRYEMIIQGGVGLFIASDKVTHKEWQDYVAYCQVQELYPGIQGLGVARFIHHTDLAQLPSDMTIHPPGEREEYCPIMFIEPHEDSNEDAIGFDLLSEPVRRNALERAITTGSAAISGRVTLVPASNGKSDPAFLMCLPIFASGKPLETVENRRADLWGYVVSGFLMTELMQGIFPNINHEVEFEIFDGSEPAASNLMFDSHVSTPECLHQKFTAQKVLNLYGRQWTLFFHSTPAFEARRVDQSPWIIFAGSIVISLLIFLFLKMLEGTGERALELAREMTHALKESEEKYRDLSDNLPVGVSAITPDMRVIVANRQLHQWFPNGDYSGQPFCYSVFHTSPRSEPCEDCPVAKAIRDGRTHTSEREAETSEGIRHFLITAIPTTSLDGTVEIVHMMVEDITEHKRAEQEKIARRTAEAANRQKSLFLSNMSHEIRTPMNAILGFAQILERDPNLSSKQREQLGSINRSGQHLLALINDILDMSKLEAGMNALKPLVFCLHDLIDDLAMMFRSRAEAKNIQFLVELGENVPYYVLADEGKIRQILINLLGNAIKFTDSGGVSMRIRVEPTASLPAENEKTRRLIVEVEDSGPGIPDTDLTNIFAPFGQGEAGGLAGGTGLGLPISHRLAEMMDGNIRVETKVGRGSCFRFGMLLELSEEPPEEKRPAPRLVIGLEPGTGPFRILVVDDKKTNRDLLCDLLRPLGFELRQAENGSEALTIFHEWTPHAVLMDMRMPVMDGYEATRKIKATPIGRDMPVIAVTASAFKDAEYQILATGVSAYVRKPFRPEELLEALGDCLNLRYVYADESPVTDRRHSFPRSTPIDPARVAALPADLLQTMRQSVDEGDMTRLMELIDQIPSQDADIAKALSALADGYEYERLNILLTPKENPDA